MNKRILFLTLGLVLFSLSLTPLPRLAHAEDPYTVVAAVNAFRTGQGLPALTIDNSLMASAQSQSDYQAAIHQVTHVGAGGTNATQRAVAFGFGGGAQAFVSENIAGGVYTTINDAIYKYWQDSLHLHTMLNPAALYIGAGVATIPSENYTYYTVDTGYYSGAVGSGTTNSGSTDTGTGYVAPTVASGAGVDPFVKAEPGENGSIVHTVGYGQSLTGIANTYDVIVGEILLLNNMQLTDVIYPGDEIIIQPSYTPTVTGSPPPPTETLTPTITPTLSDETLTPLPTFTPFATHAQSATPIPTAVTITISPEREPIVIGAVLVSMAILLAVIFAGFFKKS